LRPGQLPNIVSRWLREKEFIFEMTVHLRLTPSGVNRWGLPYRSAGWTEFVKEKPVAAARAGFVLDSVEAPDLIAAGGVK